MGHRIEVLCALNPTKTIQVAAQELKEYFTKYQEEAFEKKYKMNQVVLGKLNGLPKMEDLEKIKNHDGFLIKLYDGVLYICGKTDRGTLYGVYHFIEKYIGVEWLTPDCEIKTEGKDIPLGLEEVYDFSAYMRWNHSHAGFDQRYRARQRTNFTVGDINDVPSYGDLRGIKFAFSWGLFGHTFEVLLPYEKYYVAHPEWYSFAKAHVGENHRYQICLTNPEVLNIVTKNALAYLRENPDCNIISISQNDSYADFQNNYCVCDNCREIFEEDGSYAAVLIQFVNKVAREIKKEFPNVYVHTFAYNFTEEPPVTVTPDDNVIVQFCLHLPFGRSITENTPITNKERLKFESWNKISKRMFVWTYICNHAWYVAPIGNFKSLYDNTIYFLKSGVFGIFQQGNQDYTIGEFSNLRSYLTAKMFQNPNMTYEEYWNYLEIFTTGYFGYGGKYIAEYIKMLDRKFHYANLTPSSQNKMLSFYADEQFIAAGKVLYEKALSNTQDLVHRERILKNRLQLDFCELCLLFIQQEENEHLRKEYIVKHKSFYERQQKGGLINYKEGCKLPDLSRIDFTKSPFDLAQKDKTIILQEGQKTERFFADESTKDDYGFTFAFSLLAQKDVLEIEVEVKDTQIWYNNANITDWAQDCLEIYISETFNRVTKKGAGDYTYRVNADGVVYAYGREDKIISCKSEKNAFGYKVYLSVQLDTPISKLDKLGFEMMAHDFDENGNYISTRYWNALKFSAVFDRPDYYGIIEVKKREGEI